MKSMLKGYGGIRTAWAQVNYGQDELEFSHKPRAVELGLNQCLLAQQIRQAYYGEEAQRAQRGIDDIRVMVHLPKADRNPLMLCAVALAAWKSSEHPVVLHADSKLQFRGRTERAQTVRFGFSAQQIRGVFAGKFEMDVRPATLGPAGETWEVDLPLKDFRPLHPQLAASPEGLELTDVYALTVNEDAGLELNHFELIPAGPALPLK